MQDKVDLTEYSPHNQFFVQNVIDRGQIIKTRNGPRTLEQVLTGYTALHCHHERQTIDMYKEVVCKAIERAKPREWPREKEEREALIGSSDLVNTLEIYEKE